MNSTDLLFWRQQQPTSEREFHTVAVVLPSEDLPLLSRELLYTAVTRSKQCVVIVGAPGLLSVGVGRATERRSGLAGRLVEPAGDLAEPATEGPAE